MPKLEAFDSRDAIPEALRDYYVEQDGKWVPDAPGLHGALSGERQQRSAAVRRAEAAERKAQELETRLQALEKQPEHGSGDGDAHKSAVERLERDFKAQLKQFETQLTAERELRETAERERDESGLSDHLRSALLEEGVPKGAIEDLIALPRFRQPWKKTDSGYAPHEGEAPRYDPENPAKNMSARAYAKEYLKANPHWLPPSSGSGANGSGTPVNRGGVITVTKEQLRDASNYEKLQEQAAKTGAIIQYTDN